MLAPFLFVENLQVGVVDDVPNTRLQDVELNVVEFWFYLPAMWRGTCSCSDRRTLS
jgi:hypothetical protein